LYGRYVPSGRLRPPGACRATAAPPDMMEWGDVIRKEVTDGRAERDCGGPPAGGPADRRPGRRGPVLPGRPGVRRPGRVQGPRRVRRGDARARRGGLP